MRSELTVTNGCLHKIFSLVTQALSEEVGLVAVLLKTAVKSQN